MIQDGIQDRHNGSSDKARAGKTAPSTKEEMAIERQATWRQRVREASIRSQARFREVQDAYQRFRESHGRLLSPTLSDDESEDTSPDPDADEFGFTPPMLGLDDEWDPRIDEVFGSAFAQRYRAQASSQPAAQPWRPIGIPFSPPTTKDGWPAVYKQDARHRKGGTKLSEEQPRELSIPNQPCWSIAWGGLSTPGARELLSSRTGPYIQEPRRLTRHSHQGHAFYELDHQGQPRPVIYQ